MLSATNLSGIAYYYYRWIQMGAISVGVVLTMLHPKYSGNWQFPVLAGFRDDLSMFGVNPECYGAYKLVRMVPLSVGVVLAMLHTKHSGNWRCLVV